MKWVVLEFRWEAALKSVVKQKRMQIQGGEQNVMAE
jgi:hypothetical protein